MSGNGGAGKGGLTAGLGGGSGSGSAGRGLTGGTFGVGGSNAQSGTAGKGDGGEAGADNPCFGPSCPPPPCNKKPCCNDDSDCGSVFPRKHCNLLKAECVYCVTQDDCFWNEECVEPSGTCVPQCLMEGLNLEECKDPRRPVCASGGCVECFDSVRDCRKAEAPVCVGFECRPCKIYTDAYGNDVDVCPEGKSCHEDTGQCIPDEPMTEPEPMPDPSPEPMP